MTKRGWFIVKLAIIGLVAADMVARFWLRHVFTVDRPHAAEGIFTRPYLLNDDPSFISNADYTWLTSLEIGGFALVVVFLAVVGASTRRQRQPRT